MSTITTILSTDAPANSRAVINTNFDNLNTDKMETSVLSTSGTLAENSDSRVATQKAVKTYVDTQVATIATVPTCLTMIPRPLFTGDDAVNTASISGNTTAYTGQVLIPIKITVNKISIKTSAVSVAGTYIISMFSETGTRMFSVTTGNITTGATIYTTSVSAVALTQGVYYLMIQPVSTASATFYWWSTFTEPFGTTEGLLSDVTSEPVLAGTYVVTADTAPATITPTSVVESSAKAIIIARLDN